MSIADPKDLAQNALKQIRRLSDGNGSSADSVQIMEAKGEIISMEALTHIDIDIETNEEERVGKLQQGTFLPTEDAMNAAIESAQKSILKGNDSRKMITEQILGRPDKGFSLHGKNIPLEELKQDFSTHAPCNRCQGQGSTSCGQCQGQRQEVCTQCRGRTMIPCRQCHGNGMIQGPDGKQQQCKFCFGQRQVSCPLCQKTGRMTCRQCRGNGNIKCDPCKGGGLFTKIVSVLPVIKTLFEMNRADLPDGAIGLIERSGSRLVERDHIDIQAEPVTRKDGGLAIQYQAQFPYGKITFSINGKPVSADLFGNKAKLLKLKPFLEDLIKPGIESLKKAANNDGVVANQIKKASGHKLIGQAILLTATMPKKQAVMALKKKYPLGISNKALQSLIKTADQAIGNVTRRPRYIGLAIGLCASGVAYTGLLLTKTYANLAISLNNPALEMALAAVLIAAGGGLTHYTIKLTAKKSMTHAIGHLMKNRQSNIPTKTRTSGLYAYIGAALLFLIMVEATRHIGTATPAWYFLK